MRCAVFVAVFAVLAHIALAGLGMDFIDPVNADTIACIKGQGMFIAPRIFEDGSGGVCDPNGGNAIKLASQAGNMGIMPYVFPNPQTILHGGHNATVQAYMAVYCGAAAGMKAGGAYWLDIEVDPYNPWPDCQTSSDYILELIAAMWQFSDVCGVYSSVYEWQRVTCQVDEESRQSFVAKLAARAANIPTVGDLDDEHYLRVKNSSTVIAGSKSLALWYANWDGQPNFNDFQPFGPFKSAFAKQYADNGNICGVPCDMNFCPL